MEYLPPYVNKMVKIFEKEYFKAEKAELKAKKKYEFQTEYKNLCKVKLENAKKEEK